MTISEKAAYLKGLIEGLGVDPETGEGKLWNVLSELVGDLASELRNLQEEHEDLAESVENIEIGLEYLEDLVSDDLDDDLDEDGDEDDGFYPFAQHPYYTSDEDADDGAEDFDDRSSLGEEYYYEVECPGCGETLELSEEELEEGSLRCPGCGALLQFGFDDDEDVPDGEADIDSQDRADSTGEEHEESTLSSESPEVDVPPVF